MYESCYYIITYSSNFQPSESRISLKINSHSNANIYLFEGTSLQNATLLTPKPRKNWSAKGQSFILVSQTKPSSINSSLSFSYRVEGIAYPWWHFRTVTWKWHAVIGGGTVTALSLIIIMCFGCCCKKSVKI
jgi:hypothetical protein